MIYYYGGAFDPFTTAHYQIIKHLMRNKNDKDLVVVGVTDNAEKEYKTSQYDRMQIVNKSLDDKWFTQGLSVIPQNERTWRYLQTHFRDGTDITVVVGEDEFAELAAGKWIHSKELIQKYQFNVFTRSKIANTGVLKNTKYKHIKYQVFSLSNAKYEDVSSTSVRDIFYRNPATKYSTVKHYIGISEFKYIKENELYWQNSENYAHEEAEFLKKYADEKARNGWGEPSVTTTTIAYNGDKVLLVRRLKPPYKNYWCLCGGFFEKSDKDLMNGAAREMLEETSMDIEPSKFHQVKTYGHNFDPRMKIVDVAFSVRVPHSEMKKAKANDDAAALHWFDINELPPLAFHHATIITDWKEQQNIE